MANFNWTFVNTEGVVAVNSISASSFVSASEFHGDGSGLTNITASAAIIAEGPEFSIQFRRNTPVSGDISGSDNFTFNSDQSTLTLTGTLVVSGNISASSYTVSTIQRIYSSGSTDFGDSNDDQHVRTGSFIVASASADGAATATTVFSASVSSTPGASFIYASKLGVGVSNPTMTLTVVGEISGSQGVTGSSLNTYNTVINATHVSSSLNISGAAFYGDGTKLTGMSPITTYSNASNNRVLTSVDGSTVNSEANLNFDGNVLSVTGQISASLGITGSTGHFSQLTASAISGGSPITISGDTVTMVALGTTAGVFTANHFSSSLNISASEFYGNGAKLTGMSPITTYSNVADNRILTAVNSSTITGESNLTFDGTDLSVVSATSARPRFYIQNENADEHPGQLIFNKTSSSPAEDDTIGRVVFSSHDAAGNATVYGQIEGDIKKPDSGGERGRIKFSVAEYDGTLTEALTLQGDNADGTVSVTVANGTLSLPNGDIHLHDDRKVIFGNASDASIEYDENGRNTLIISGSQGGVEISGSGVLFDPGTVVSGAIGGPGSYLGINTNGKLVLTASSGGGTPGGSDTQVQYNNGGAFGGVASLTFDDSGGHLTVIDDKKLIFGTNSDSSIEYDENGRNTLIISGSQGGIEISGSSVLFDPATVASGSIGGPGSYVGINSDGKLVLTASSGGGTPGGSDTQIQYNNGGAFGGVASLTFNDSSGDLTVIDDEKLFFGTNSDAHIEYDEDGDNQLIISGSISGIAVLSDNVIFKTAQSTRPRIYIQNENADQHPGQLIFNKTSSSPTEDDTIGRIVFSSHDAAGNATVYGQIDGEIKKSTSGGERGRIKFTIAEYDGTATEAFTLQGDAADGSVSVTVSNGTLNVPNGNIHLYDDRKIVFGNGSDSSIEYDENGRNTLIISGSQGGIEISGSGILFDPVTIASGAIGGPGSYVGMNSDGKLVLTASSGGGDITGDNNTFSGVNTFSGQLTASAGINIAGGISLATSVKTANFTAANNEYLLFCDLTGAVITGTLPLAAAAGAGKSYIFKDVSGSASSFNLVISGSANETIDGASLVKITSNSGSVTCVSNGVNWFIIGTS